MSAPLPPLPRKLAALTDDLTVIPPGYGFRTVSTTELLERATTGDLLHVFQVWEPPLRGHRYIVSADVADGIGLDRSVVDVTRVGTLERCEEQVAQYLSDRIKPRELAFVIDAIGHYYCDDNGIEALAAIETNSHGLSTQDTLQLHLGYTEFYRWETLDAADPQQRFTTRIGWYTTPRSRPILLDHFWEAVTTIDPLTGLPDLRLNSPWTLDELGDFQTDGALQQAEAARGAHDDCILASAIGHYVAWRLAGGEAEPLADRRRRHHQMRERQARLQSESEARFDYRNMAYTEAEISDFADRASVDLDAELEALMEVRGVMYDEP